MANLQYEVFQIPGDQTRLQSDAGVPVATFAFSYEAREYCKKLDYGFRDLFFVMVDIFGEPVDWMED